MSHFAGVVTHCPSFYSRFLWKKVFFFFQASASDEVVITWFGPFVILASKHGALPGGLFPWSLPCFYNYPKWRNDCLKCFFFSLSALSAS